MAFVIYQIFLPTEEDTRREAAKRRNTSTTHTMPLKGGSSVREGSWQCQVQRARPLEPCYTRYELTKIIILSPRPRISPPAQAEGSGGGTFRRFPRLGPAEPPAHSQQQRYVPILPSYVAGSFRAGGWRPCRAVHTPLVPENGPPA